MSRAPNSTVDSLDVHTHAHGAHTLLRRHSSAYTCSEAVGSEFSICQHDHLVELRSRLSLLLYEGMASPTPEHNSRAPERSWVGWKTGRRCGLAVRGWQGRK